MCLAVHIFVSTPLEVITAAVEQDLILVQTKRLVKEGHVIPCMLLSMERRVAMDMSRRVCVILHVI